MLAGCRKAHGIYRQGVPQQEINRRTQNCLKQCVVSGLSSLLKEYREGSTGQMVKRANTTKKLITDRLVSRTALENLLPAGRVRSEGNPIRDRVS